MRPRAASRSAACSARRKASKGVKFLFYAQSADVDNTVMELHRDDEGNFVVVICDYEDCAGVLKREDIRFCQLLPVAAAKMAHYLQRATEDRQG